MIALMKKGFHAILLLGLPVFLWLFLAKNFFLSKLPIYGETVYIYWVIKLFVENLRLGTIALWNPFLYLGFPLQVWLSYVGIFNPTWLLTLLLNCLGLSFYHSFLYSITLYLLASQIGFYLLAKTILEDARAAYIAFLLFLFSSFTFIALGGQYNPALHYLPSIWCFYFFFRFLKTWKASSFLGFIFSLIIVLTTYLPFYFLTVFGITGLLLLIFNFRNLGPTVKNFHTFIRKRPFLLVICTLAVLFSLWPGYAAYQSTSRHEVVAPFRQTQDKDMIYKKGVVLNNYESVTDGGVSARMAPEELYSYLDLLHYGNDGMFYMSILAYLFLLLGAINRINKRNAVLVALAFFLFLLVLENATPLHRWLFQSIPYFRLIRTITFFLPFLGATVALLAAEQLRLILTAIEHAPENRTRYVLLAWILIVHGACGTFLIVRPEVPVYSFIALILSLIFFLLFILARPYIPSAFFTIFIAAAILFHPVKFFWRFAQMQGNPKTIQEYLKVESTRPSFSFTRSSEKKPISWYSISKTDAPGSWGYGDTFVSYWAFYLNDHLPKDVIDSYTRNKFYLYNHIEISTNSQPDIKTVADSFQNLTDLAFISLDSAKEMDTKLATLLKPSVVSQAHAEIVEKSSPLFEVTYFGLNSLKIKTNFPEKKFLVYTDSFDQRWEAFRNKKPIPVYRANIAFKGVFLPAGLNEVVLRFHPPGGGSPYAILLIFYWGLFFATIVMIYRDKNTEINQKRV